MLQLNKVSKVYDGHFSLEVDISVGPGEFVSLLGPSGCGKTSLLRIIAGLEAPDSGTVVIGGRDVTTVPPHLRGVGMVFQDYALFPHMTVCENVEYGLRVGKVPRAERVERAQSALGLVGLPGAGRRDVTTLSGGERQRVALARSIVTRPSILLLDEPFSALDQQVRLALRREVRELQRRLGMTMVFVTHNQEEALSLSDTVVVMSRGSVEQVGPPREVYSKPQSLYTADFLGELNHMQGRLSCAPGRCPVIALAGGTEVCWSDPSVPGSNGLVSDATLCFRPEDATCRPSGEGGQGAVRGAGEECAAMLSLQGVVSELEFLGPFTLISTDTVEGKVKVITHGRGLPTLKELVRIDVPIARCFAFPTGSADPQKGATARCRG